MSGKVMIPASSEGATRYRDAHDAELGRERRARPARDHEGREDGPQLADDRERHRGPEERLGAEAGEREEDLKPEHHAGEGARQQNDQQRAEADVVDAADQRPQLEGRRDGGHQRLDEEGPEPTHRLDDPDDPPAEALEGAQQRRDGRLSHACAWR
jgi:hypothetical protein